MINLKSVRGFHVGGEMVRLSGLAVSRAQAATGGPVRVSDPNGSYQTGQLYAQYFEQAQPRGLYPLMLWHGGGLTGASWEDTPDGRAGWNTFFLCKGYSTVLSDAPERGRSGWPRYPQINPQEPEHRTIEQAWGQFRFGPGGGYMPKETERTYFTNQRFPTQHADQFAKQFVARWTNTADITLKAYLELVGKMGPCVIVAHSQGAYFALQAARHTPNLVKAVVLLEPAGAPDIPTGPLPDVCHHIPHLAIWGDYFDNSVLWREYRERAERYLAALHDRNVLVSHLDLPKTGIRGNSHMLMMDSNSDEIALHVHDWLTEAGCYR